VQKKFLPKSIFFLFGTVLSIGLGFLYKDYIIKNFDLSVFGAFSFIISTISLISNYTSLGYKDSLIFFIPKYLSLEKPRKIFFHIKNTILINSIFLLIIFLCFIIIDEIFLFDSFVYKKFHHYKYYFFIILLLHSFILIGIEIINGFEKIHFSVLVEKILKWPIKFSFIIILLNAGYGFKGILFAEITSSILVFSFLLLIIYNITRSHDILTFNKTILSRLEESEKNYIKNIFSNNLLTSFNDYTITLIILFYTTYEELGVFSLLSSFAFFISIILISINSVLKPIISKLYARKDISAIEKYFKLSCKLNFLMTVPIFIIMYFFIDYIFIYMNLDISGSKVLFVLLIFGQLINALKGPVYITIRMMGYAKELKYINFFQLIINFVIFNLFISKYGLTGIGLSVLFSFIVQALVGSTFLYLRTKIHMYDKEYLVHVLLSMCSISILFFTLLITNVFDHDYGELWFLIIGMIVFFLTNFIYLNKKHNMLKFFSMMK
jgi:O-antigen/teichoic acid export membrane protein